MVALIGFKKFEDTDEAHLEISRVVFDLAISEDFLNFLRANCQQHEILGVAYQPLARAIHVKSLNTVCIINIYCFFFLVCVTNFLLNTGTYDHLRVQPQNNGTWPRC